MTILVQREEEQLIHRAYLKILSVFIFLFDNVTLTTHKPTKWIKFIYGGTYMLIQTLDTMQIAKNM